MHGAHPCSHSPRPRLPPPVPQQPRRNKEHLTVVVDPAQLQDEPALAPPMHSRMLDAIWSEFKTEMDRITWGTYVGRLSKEAQRPSRPPAQAATPAASSNTIVALPLPRMGRKINMLRYMRGNTHCANACIVHTMLACHCHCRGRHR